MYKANSYMYSKDCRKHVEAKAMHTQHRAKKKSVCAGKDGSHTILRRYTSIGQRVSSAWHLWYVYSQYLPILQVHVQNLQEPKRGRTTACWDGAVQDGKRFVPTKPILWTLWSLEVPTRLERLGRVRTLHIVLGKNFHKIWTVDRSSAIRQWSDPKYGYADQGKSV